MGNNTKETCFRERERERVGKEYTINYNVKKNIYIERMRSLSAKKWKTIKNRFSNWERKSGFKTIVQAIANFNLLQSFVGIKK